MAAIPNALPIHKDTTNMDLSSFSLDEYILRIVRAATAASGVTLCDDNDDVFSLANKYWGAFDGRWSLHTNCLLIGRPILQRLIFFPTVGSLQTFGAARSNASSPTSF